jgi:3-hydroxyacyl-CoA dehydrogenase
MPPIDNVLIVGAGWVGRQVAARMAQYGLHVWLVDRDAAVVEQALAWIAELTTSVADSFQYSLEQAAPVSSAEPALADCQSRVRAGGSLMELSTEDLSAWHIDLILESVPEQISIKKRVLRQLSHLAAAPCIIASNSSYLVPSITSQFVQQPERFAHLHFHVPVLRRSVCDVVGCSQTEPEVLSRLVELARRIEQPPIQLRREHPGYIFNWLLQSVLRGALELRAKDVADPEDIDHAWKSVSGMPLGPFAIMDQIGLDVIEQVLSNARWAVPSEINEDDLIAVVRPLVHAGRLGIKSGAGFYNYRDDVDYRNDG